VPGAETSAVIGSNEEVLRMVPDERLNSSSWWPRKDDGAGARSGEALDTPVPYEQNNMHIYSC
jgi:hypothetical protein